MSINFCVACRQHQDGSKNFQMLSPRKMCILFSKIACQFMCIKSNRFVRNTETWTLIGHIGIALDATKPLLLYCCSFSRKFRFPGQCPLKINFRSPFFYFLFLLLANFGSSFGVYMVHIATFQNKQDSHCLVVPVAASVHFVIIDPINLTDLVSFIILNHHWYI